MSEGEPRGARATAGKVRRYEAEGEEAAETAALYGSPWKQPLAARQPAQRKHASVPPIREERYRAPTHRIVCSHQLPRDELVHEGVLLPPAQRAQHAHHAQHGSMNSMGAYTAWWASWRCRTTPERAVQKAPLRLSGTGGRGRTALRAWAGPPPCGPAHRSRARTRAATSRGPRISFLFSLQLPSQRPASTPKEPRQPRTAQPVARSPECRGQPALPGAELGRRGVQAAASRHVKPGARVSSCGRGRGRSRGALGRQRGLGFRF